MSKPRVRLIDRPLPETNEEWLTRAKEQQARFWSKVDRSDSGCWRWLGGKVDKDGYGKFQITGRGPRFRGDSPVQKDIGAHRLAWQLANDRIVPLGLVVMHACDNPICCNPEHLSVGTQAENRADCGRKGREPRGEAHHSAKITAAIAMEIAQSNERRRDLAKRLGVSTAIVDQVRRGRTWGHVTGKAAGQ